MITSPNIIPGSRNTPTSSFPWKTVLACVSGLAVTAPIANAQQVWMQPPSVPLYPAAVMQYQTNQATQVFAPTGTVGPAPAETSPFRFGPMVLRPHLSYRFLYGNGIQTSPGQQHDTVVQQILPGALIEVGEHWTLDYTPTLSFYSAGGFRNTVDHHVYLGWGSEYGNWFLRGSQSYVSSSSPNVQTAAQTDEETYATVLSGVYQFNEKMSLDLGVNQDLNFVSNTGSSTNYQQNLSDWRNWSTMDWFSYQFWPRLDAGLGAGFGFNQQDNSPDSIYEQYQARVNWRATDKISFQLSGGLQDQQYLSGGANDLITPIFSGAVQYQPFEQTRLRVNASRSVSKSYFQSQTTENTSITGSLNQRLLGKLYLDLSGGYTQTKYVASSTAISTSRKDNYYTFNARLSCPFLKRGTFAVLYQYSDNSSSQSGFASGSSAFAYTSDQIGFEISYRY